LKAEFRPPCPLGERQEALMTPDEARVINSVSVGGALRS
jgi:hypothetical protein